MPSFQPGILAEVPACARFLTFHCLPGRDTAAALRRLTEVDAADALVVGLGPSLVKALGARVEGLRPLPHHTAPGIDVPSTPTALWCWLRGDDRGEIYHRGRALEATLAGAFALDEVVDAFCHGSGRDLTGYEDGTENPEGEAALAAAFVSGRGAGLDGSSFVAAQRWVHDFSAFDAMSGVEQDHSIGRRRSDNEELDDAPPSAHVKRTAQESFEPEAFVLRRSMPWSCGREAGLVFVAFGRSLDAFEALLRRMVGHEDDITDALFRFTRPVTGGAFWCPPVAGGRLDLSAVGIGGAPRRGRGR